MKKGSPCARSLTHVYTSRSLGPKVSFIARIDHDCVRRKKIGCRSKKKELYVSHSPRNLPKSINQWIFKYQTLPLSQCIVAGGNGVRGFESASGDLPNYGARHRKLSLNFLFKLHTPLSPWELVSIVSSEREIFTPLSRAYYFFRHDFFHSFCKGLSGD